MLIRLGVLVVLVGCAALEKDTGGSVLPADSETGADKDSGAASEELSGTIPLSDADAIFTAQAHGDYAGESVAGAGDVDGDGLGDLLVGEVGSGSGWKGTVYLILGKDAAGESPLSSAHAVRIGVQADDKAGSSAAAAGDVDVDGYADVLVGAPSNGTGAGVTYLLHGPLSGEASLAAADAIFAGPPGSSYCSGDAVAGGDTDGDGTPDVVIAAPYGGGAARGLAYVLYGPLSGAYTLGPDDAQVMGGTDSTYLGESQGLALPGDTDGDGVEDLLVGAYGHADQAGGAWLLAGPIAGLVSASDAAASWVGETSQDHAGLSVSGAGDANGDGYLDIVIGAPGYSGGANLQGAAYVLYGPFAGEASLGDADAILLGEGEDSSAGNAAADAGDVDGDGRSDLLIGSYRDQNGGSWTGAVYLVVDAPEGTISLGDAQAKLVGESPGGQAGHAVDGAGDVNGDGFADVIVGANYAGRAYLILGGSR